ncbi:hypothetical protein GCM10009429_34210 [Dyella marensis]
MDSIGLRARSFGCNAHIYLGLAIDLGINRLSLTRKVRRSLYRPPSENAPLAKTNYSFEKRQREMAKKKKQDDKQAKKVASRDGARTEPVAGTTNAKSI